MSVEPPHDLDGVEADECLFVDDLDLNCEAARALGMTAVQYTGNETTIPRIESALDASG